MLKCPWCVPSIGPFDVSTDAGLSLFADHVVSHFVQTTRRRSGSLSDTGSTVTLLSSANPVDGDYESLDLGDEHSAMMEDRDILSSVCASAKLASKYLLSVLKGSLKGYFAQDEIAAIILAETLTDEQYHSALADALFNPGLSFDWPKDRCTLIGRLAQAYKDSVGQVKLIRLELPHQEIPVFPIEAILLLWFRNPITARLIRDCNERKIFPFLHSTDQVECARILRTEIDRYFEVINSFYFGLYMCTCKCSRTGLGDQLHCLKYGDHFDGANFLRSLLESIDIWFSRWKMMQGRFVFVHLAIFW
jgi:hypothetical protein